MYLIVLWVKYNKSHIIEVFKANYAFASEFYPEVNTGLDITQDHLVSDWISDMDLIPKPLVQLNHFNEQYNAQIPRDSFNKLWNAKTSTLGDLAQLIVEHAKPRPLPRFKFGGKSCETGAILRFLTLRMQAAAPAGLRIRPSTPFSQMFNQQEIGHISELLGFLPGAIKPPKKVYHWRILPKSLRMRFVTYTTSGAIALSFAVYSFFWGVRFQTTWAVVALLLVFLCLKIDKNAKPKSHWIFLGSRNLRELVAQESRKDHPYWKDILTKES